jgi:MFS family permease
MTMSEGVVAEVPERPPSGRRGLYRFLFFHQIDRYPATLRRTGYLAVAVLATVVLYYTYYTQTGVTPNILAYYHMSFQFYVGIVVVSNVIGAFASLPASKTDRVGRANVVIYGLLIVGLLVAFGVPATHSQWTFATVICLIGLVEGAILVATPAMVRDYSPQLGRASAMGFWTIGPVAGSLVTSIVANHTLSHFGDWQSQFIISGVTSLVMFGVALLFMKDLSPRLRDQLMVSATDRALVQARASGISDEQVRQATSHPWRQIVKWDLVGSSLGISIFLLIYYAAASFFTIYYVVTFVNADGLPFSVTQANGLNTWFWTADIIALIVAGILSDWLRVRKPFMLIGTFGAIGFLLWFSSLANDPHTGYYTLALISMGLAVFLSVVYAPWMAGYTESVEAKNPALVGTGLALWGWILRLVVGISFLILPLVIHSVNDVVDNQALANTIVGGQPISTFTVKHADSVAFAQQHAALLKLVSEHQDVVSAAAANPTAANQLKVVQALGLQNALELQRLQSQFQTLVVPYQAQLNFLSAHADRLAVLQKAVKESPPQWQHWFWVDVAGMVLFIPTIWLTKGRWNPRRAKQDAVEHDQIVAEELARLGRVETSETATTA